MPSTEEGYFRSSRKILCRFQDREVESLAYVRTSLSTVRTLISKQHPSGCGGNTVHTPISVEKLRGIQGFIRPNVMATCPDALQSSKRIQRSSASVRTTLQYRPDAFQFSTSKRISFADTDMGRQLQLSGRQVYTVRTLSLIRQDMEKNYNRPDVKETPSER
jgi:hypothetical protein